MIETRVRGRAWTLLAAAAVGATLLSFLPAQRASQALNGQVVSCEFFGSNTTAATSGGNILPIDIINVNLTCSNGLCGPGYSCVQVMNNITNITKTINTTMIYDIGIGCGCVMDTPTATPTDTPTATPTATPSATPTGTKIPEGGACDDPLDCVTGNCVDDVCCDTACDQPGQACNVAGLEGTCLLESAPVPAVSQRGMWGLIVLLVAIGGIGMMRWRRIV
jgi:hypothetical protein